MCYEKALITSCLQSAYPRQPLMNQKTRRGREKQTQSKLWSQVVTSIHVECRMHVRGQWNGGIELQGNPF